MSFYVFYFELLHTFSRTKFTDQRVYRVRPKNAESYLNVYIARLNMTAKVGSEIPSDRWETCKLNLNGILIGAPCIQWAWRVGASQWTALGVVGRVAMSAQPLRAQDFEDTEPSSAVVPIRDRCSVARPVAADRGKWNRAITTNSAPTQVGVYVRGFFKKIIATCGDIRLKSTFVRSQGALLGPDSLPVTMQCVYTVEHQR